MAARDPIVRRYGKHASRGEMAALLFKLLRGAPLPSSTEEEYDRRTLIGG